MNFGLTDEQQMVVNTVRGFVEKELYPLEPEVERTGRVPKEMAREIQRKVKALGFYAPNIPEEFGGGGLDNVTFALLERELGRTTWALHVWWGRPSNILCAGNAEQRARYLAPSVRGEKTDALAISEPDAGSDIRGMRCAARKDGADWIINGTKHFISHADAADFVILFASTGEEKVGGQLKKRITCFLVDKGTPGFEVKPGYQSVSYRGYTNSILTFDDCRVSSAQILGEEGRGFELANTWLRSTRLSVAATSVGKARRALELALNHAARRRQFGSPIGKFQGVSFQLADMVTEIDAAEYLTLAAAWRRHQPRDGGVLRRLSRRSRAAGRDHHRCRREAVLRRLGSQGSRGGNAAGQRLRHRRIRRAPAASQLEQAGDRRRQRDGGGRRLRAGPIGGPDHRGRTRALRASRGTGRHHCRCGHRQAATPHSVPRRHGPAVHRSLDGCAGGTSLGSAQRDRSGRRADGNCQEAGAGFGTGPAARLRGDQRGRPRDGNTTGTGGADTRRGPAVSDHRPALLE